MLYWLSPCVVRFLPCHAKHTKKSVVPRFLLFFCDINIHTRTHAHTKRIDNAVIVRSFGGRGERYRDYNQIIKHTERSTLILMRVSIG